MRQREVIAALGTAAAWPFAGRAQQAPASKVHRIGYPENFVARANEVIE